MMEKRVLAFDLKSRKKLIDEDFESHAEFLALSPIWPAVLVAGDFIAECIALPAFLPMLLLLVSPSNALILAEDFGVHLTGGLLPNFS